MKKQIKMSYIHSGYKSSKRRKKSPIIKVLLVIILILLVVLGIGAYQLYITVLKPNTWVPDGREQAIYIKTGSDYDDVLTILYGNGIVINRKTFEWLAERKKLAGSIRPGKFLIKAGMSNNELINLLRSGTQQPVKLIFNNIRTKDELAETIGSQIEADSAEILQLLNDTLFLKNLGYNPMNVLALFIPNTYEVYWTMDAKEFINRMFLESNRFWTADRQKKAEGIGLEPVEVSILASIVEKETTKVSEMPTMAGVYANRLKYGWKLQADPTIVYAWGDFSIQRVLNIHKQIESPYNTYLNYGLPPGPICIPSIAAIDAVLNREDHNYMYFCAKADFSGFHEFARTNEEHNINANRYRRALDALNIKN
jgi:UPF0755 protein